MSTIKPRKNIDGKGFHFYHEADNRLFQRIVAGFVPPSERPGAIVIVGEEATWRPPAHVIWLTEAIEQTLDNLINCALDLRAEFQVQDFYGRTNDEALISFLSLRNREARERRMAQLHILSAPNSDSGEISYHISILRDRLSPNKKTLHLDKSKLLPNALQELPVDKIATATDREYPIVAALSYAVSALTEWEFFENQRPTRAKTEYDILNYMNE